MDRRLRRVIAFPCGSDMLLATLDEAAGSTGLLIVSGGNEVRCGAHRGMARLAADVAATGHPVFRYDRRGIGDSGGENHGFLSAADDLAVAIAAFRAAAPHVARIVGFGNCDAASTLALFGRAAGVDALVLANPWVIEPVDDLPPAAAIRARYAARLRDPLSLLCTGIDLRQAWRGLRRIVAPPPPTSLSRRVIAAIESWGTDATILLAATDATARAFQSAAPHLRAETIATGSHSFAGEARTALLAAVVRQLQATGRE